MQPLVQATTRTPGPSTVEPVVNECRKPMSPVASAVRTSDSGTFFPRFDAQFERALRLERRLRERRSLRHDGLLTATSSP